MKEKVLYAIWGGLYILCVGLGFISEPAGFGKFLLVLTALIFFLPGGAILYYGLKGQDRKMLLRLRIVCISSLLLTMVLLVANILSAAASVAIGNLLYELLALVSAPMLCGQYWVMSLFLWACLLMGTFLKKK